MTSDWRECFPADLQAAEWVACGEVDHSDLDTPMNQLGGNAWLLPQKSGNRRELLWLNLGVRTWHPPGDFARDRRRWGDEDMLPVHRCYEPAIPADLNADVAMVRGYLHAVLPETAELRLPPELVATDCSPAPNAGRFPPPEPDVEVCVYFTTQWVAFALMLEAKGMHRAADEILFFLRNCEVDTAARIQRLGQQALRERIRICFEEFYGRDGGDWLAFADELELLAKAPLADASGIPPLTRMAALARSCAAAPLVPPAAARRLSSAQLEWLTALANLRCGDASELSRQILGIWTLPAKLRPAILQDGMALIPALSAALRSSRLMRVASSRELPSRTKKPFAALLKDVLRPHDELMVQAFGFSTEALSLCALPGTRPPVSLAEFAALLLLPVIPPLPRHLQGEDPAALFAQWVAEWSSRHLEDTPEELALEYIRCGTRAQVQAATGVLLRTGSPSQQNELISLVVNSAADRTRILSAAALPLLASGEPAFYPAGQLLLERTLEDLERHRDGLEAAGVLEWVMGEVKALQEAAESASPEALVARVAAGQLELTTASGAARICFGRLTGAAMQKLILRAIPRAVSADAAVALLDVLEAWPEYRESYFESRPADEPRDFRLCIDDAAADWLAVLQDERAAITGSCAVRRISWLAAGLLLRLDARQQDGDDALSDFLDAVPVRGGEWAVEFAAARLAEGPSLALPELNPAPASAWPDLLATWHDRLSDHDLTEKLDALPPALLAGIAEDEFAEEAGPLGEALQRQSCTIARLNIAPEHAAATRFFARFLHQPLSAAVFRQMVAWLEREAAGGHFGVLVLQSIAPWRGLELWWLPDVPMEGTLRTFIRLDPPDSAHGHDVYLRAALKWEKAQWPVDVFGQLHQSQSRADHSMESSEDGRAKFLAEAESTLRYAAEGAGRGNRLECLIHSFTPKQETEDPE